MFLPADTVCNVVHPSKLTVPKAASSFGECRRADPGGFANRHFVLLFSRRVGGFSPVLGSVAEYSSPGGAVLTGHSAHSRGFRVIQHQKSHQLRARQSGDGMTLFGCRSSILLCLRWAHRKEPRQFLGKQARKTETYIEQNFLLMGDFQPGLKFRLD